MQSRLPFDDVAWEKSDNVYFKWRAELLKQDNLREIAMFVAKYHHGTPSAVRTPLTGAYNVVVVIDFREGGSTLIRFPKPGKVMFPEEKVRNEVAIMRYIEAHTSIPVPFILHWGTKDQSPCGLGPFIIMEYVDHACDISDALNTPGRPHEERPVLDPSVDQAKPRKLYGQIADVLLQISTLSFSKIGSLTQVDEQTRTMAARPLASNMNHTAWNFTTLEATCRRCNIRDLFFIPHHTRKSTPPSFNLSTYLFRKLSLEGKLSDPEHDSGPFKLWCDDLRPANFLVNSNYELVAVIDWEFTYSAPVEFSVSPPWWLLIEQPEYWPDGIDEWVTAYEPRLQTFLTVLREREDALVQAGRLEDQHRLSPKMQKSWDSGDFWVAYAARKSFAFDAIFWKHLDARFFEPMARLDRSAWERRAELLDDEERMQMEDFVHRKLDESKIRVLAWEPAE
ncbi:hypothetical protein V490_01572 [Pseudogymnoascus sp. VKM F-3557]|nr:hypothetical protein V490_01572 [Pseudogymnoascus sp. VKM F-3557]